MGTDLEPIRFISEQIQVTHDTPPVLSKRPGPPSAFQWRGEAHQVRELISSWFDFGRSGDMAHNMAPAHLETAAGRGSWGVGKFFFRVLTSTGRVFDLYYDRAPKDAGDRQGLWILWRELAETQ